MIKEIPINSVEYDICKTQGEIYEYAAKKGYHIKEFSDAYLHSDFCRRAMDTEYSRFQLEEAGECWDFIEPEIGSYIEEHKYSGEAIFDPAVAYWIGFTYRWIYIRTMIRGEELTSKVSFEDLVAYYPGLHTIDEGMAFETIYMDLLKEKAE